MTFCALSSAKGMDIKMKRRLLGVLLAVAMVGTLAAGCGSKSTESEKKTEDKKVIQIAGTAVSEVFYEAFKDKYEAEGYKTGICII